MTFGPRERGNDVRLMRKGGESKRKSKALITNTFWETLKSKWELRPDDDDDDYR